MKKSRRKKDSTIEVLEGELEWVRRQMALGRTDYLRGFRDALNRAIHLRREMLKLQKMVVAEEVDR